jgi:hypothetical protein
MTGHPRKALIMTDPTTTPTAPADTPTPEAAHFPAPQTGIAPHAPAEELTVTVRRAAAQALQHVSETVAYGTDPHGLLAAIAEQARAAALANGLPDGGWDQGRVEGAALVTLAATTLTTGEATAALVERLRDLDADELARRLGYAAFFIRP